MLNMPPILSAEIASANQARATAEGGIPAMQEARRALPARELSVRLQLNQDVRIHDQRSLDTASVDTFIDWNLHAGRRFTELEPGLPADLKNSVLAFTYVLACNVLLAHGRKKRAWRKPRQHFLARKKCSR